jgi:hypothetical protein
MAQRVKRASQKRQARAYCKKARKVRLQSIDYTAKSVPRLIICMLKYNREKMQPEVWYWTLVNLSSSVNVVLWLLDTAIFALLLQEESYYDHASSRIG